MKYWVYWVEMMVDSEWVGGLRYYMNEVDINGDQLSNIVGRRQNASFVGTMVVNSFKAIF